MANAFKFVQNQPTTLYGAGAVIGDTSIVLTTFTQIDGTLLTMTNFGSKGYLTIEPGTPVQEEQVSFTNIVQNANGTATLLGISHVLDISPYTETSQLQTSHAGGVQVVVTNTAGFYNNLVAKDVDATITGTDTFTALLTTQAGITNSGASINNSSQKIINLLDPTNPQDAASKHYVDNVAIAGAPNLDTVTNGIAQGATIAQQGTHTDIGSTGAHLLPMNTNLIKVSSGAADVSRITVLNALGQFDQGFIPPPLIGTSGEAITAGMAVYLKAADSRIYKALGTGDESTFSFTGIAIDTVAGAGLSIRVSTPGQVNLQVAALSAGAYYYVTDVAGVLGTTPGTRYAKIGQALSATSLRVIEPKFVSRGTLAISATGNTTVTTGFFPAEIELFSTSTNFVNNAPTLCFGDDTNNCVNIRTIVANIGSQPAAKAVQINEGSGTSDGTITSKSATGFVFNCGTHHGDFTVQYVAYSL